MPFNETIKQLTTQTRNHASNFNEVNNKLLENTIYNKEQLELLKTQVDGLETIEWEEVAGKPTTFPAEEHRHNVSEIDGLDNVGGEITWNSITGKPSTFPPSSHTHKKSEITDFPTSLPANGGNADTVDGKHASDFASATGVNNNFKLGQYVKFYDYDDGGSDATMKQAYLRDGKWITGFTDITVGGSGTGFQQQLNDLKSSVNGIKIIKSIQRGVFTYSGDAVQTINISAVNMSKSVIILGGSWCKKSDVGYLPHLNLTSSTQITVTRGWTSESYDTSVAWQVVEFY